MKKYIPKSEVSGIPVNVFKIRLEKIWPNFPSSETTQQTLDKSRGKLHFFIKLSFYLTRDLSLSMGIFRTKSPLFLRNYFFVAILCKTIKTRCIFGTLNWEGVFEMVWFKQQTGKPCETLGWCSAGGVLQRPSFGELIRNCQWELRIGGLSSNFPGNSESPSACSTASPNES